MDGDIERRAQIHAALGDPVRLAIVDHLSLGDASPGELARTFGVPTNLLAHHLRALQTADLIRRVRSEGDRRRTYVQRCLEDRWGLAGPVAAVTATRVVFVCTHNSARSQLAAAEWKRVHSVPTLSAGTHPAPRVHARAISIGSRHGLRLARAKTSDAADVLRADDFIVAVCDSAYEQLDEAALHWAVPDPVRIGTDAAFERAYQEISGRVARLARATTSGKAA
ncbi:MAG: helix-turn-helix domain-containing protein [Geodermatophilaceae bacterium]|nr:helix-turn-helix domain-containing protein [Geodermatophilaceae bacterium]